MHGSQFKDFYNESSDEGKRQIVDTLNKVTVIIALGNSGKNIMNQSVKRKLCH